MGDPLRYHRTYAQPQLAHRGAVDVRVLAPSLYARCLVLTGCNGLATSHISSAVRLPNMGRCVSWTTAGGARAASSAGMSTLSTGKEAGRGQVALGSG